MLLNTTHLALCLDGRNSAYRVTDCGAPPIPKPTSPLKINIQMKVGENDDRKPKKNVTDVQQSKHILRPKRSHIFPQSGLLSIIPQNTTFKKKQL